MVHDGIGSFTRQRRIQILQASLRRRVVVLLDDGKRHIPRFQLLPTLQWKVIAFANGPADLPRSVFRGKEAGTKTGCSYQYR